MQDNFSIINEAFAKNGVDIKSAAYSFTAYSLNTPLSFKFENLAELTAFLHIKGQDEAERLRHMLTDAALEPDKFFFVNFYKPKVAEL